MKAGKPSATARFVALTRAKLDRPEVPTGDADAEARLYQSLGRSPLGRGSHRWQQRMARRTAFFDGAVLAALDRGARQFVIVGAGYDGRALRFATPGATWFEVRSLEAAGFDAAAPSLFIVEGLLGYLPRATTSRVLIGLRALAIPESRLAVAFPIAPRDQPRVKRLRRRVSRMVVSALGEPWLTRFSMEDIDEVFDTTGWRVSVELDAPQRHEGHFGVLILGEPVDPGT